MKEQKLEVYFSTDEKGRRIASIFVDSVKIKDCRFQERDEVADEVKEAIEDHISQEFDYPIERKHYFKVTVRDVDLDDEKYTPREKEELKKKIFPFTLKISLLESDAEYKDIGGYINDLIGESLRKHGIKPNFLAKHTFSTVDYRLEEICGNKITVIRDDREKPKKSLDEFVR